MAVSIKFKTPSTPDDKNTRSMRKDRHKFYNHASTSASFQSCLLALA